MCKDVVESFSQRDHKKNPKFSVKFGSRKSEIGTSYPE